mgnify:CR=1 FL=1
MQGLEVRKWRRVSFHAIHLDDNDYESKSLPIEEVRLAGQLFYITCDIIQERGDGMV